VTYTLERRSSSQKDVAVLKTREILAHLLHTQRDYIETLAHEGVIGPADLAALTSEVHAPR
jgi:hypothetical protein